MATIQDLINAIPDAQDGDVIISDDHNAIKKALKAIAGQLGGSVGGQSITVTMPPNFLPVAGSTPWNVKVGFAEDSGSSSRGWLPLTLPEGAILAQLVAIGLKTNATPTGSVQLQAVPIDGTGPNILAAISLKNIAIDNPFTITVPVQVTSSLTGLLTVHNSQFKYVIAASADLSTTAASITLYAFQVIYTTP